MRMYVFDCHNRKSRDLGIKNTVMYSGLERNEMTGLLKKRSFISEAERLLQTQDDKNWCLVSIDIENFKLFNEWYGHNEGDLLMVQIGAALLQAGERTGGTAGYFGQDDFCLLAPFDMELIGTLYDDIASLVSSRGGNVGFLPAFGVCKVEKGYPPSTCSTVRFWRRRWQRAATATVYGFLKKVCISAPTRSTML
ncbi:GGDEF domain-containing protein [Ruminococcus sp. JL13D9]|uniref:GGDEF domain-containing protein n=1 Tax=Ruminococcus sp. JL13D9 TaxID=3233381 RepID=UPI00389AE081